MESLKMRLIVGAVLVIFMSIHMGTTLQCYSCQNCPNASQISNVVNCSSDSTACFNYTNTLGGNSTVTYGCGLATKCQSLSGAINGSCSVCSDNKCNYYAPSSGNNSNSSGSSNSTNNGHNAAGPLVRNSNLFLGIALIIGTAFMANSFHL